MGTVLSSFGTVAVAGGVGGGRGGARKRPDGGSGLDVGAAATAGDDDSSSNVKSSISKEDADKKQPPSPSTPGKQWPCSNCHSMVASDQVRCSNCHGIQVRIHPSNGTTTAPPHFVYLERVVSPSGATTAAAAITNSSTSAAAEEASSSAPSTPSDNTPQEPAFSGTPLKEVLEESNEAKGQRHERESNDDDSDDNGDGESVTSDYYDNDGMDDVETLEASPRPSDFVVGEYDEFRPMNPVAATLASVPSPIPVPLKLDATALLHPSSPFAATTALVDEATISLSDGYENKKRPALVGGAVFADSSLGEGAADGAVQLLPSNNKTKKRRMS
jgi:hypothetical protein